MKTTRIWTEMEHVSSTDDKNSQDNQIKISNFKSNFKRKLLFYNTICHFPYHPVTAECPLID